MTRVLTAVLLQETQPLDSKGESTIASTYTSWYVCEGWRGEGEKGEGLMKGWEKGGEERGVGGTQPLDSNLPLLRVLSSFQCFEKFL